MPNTLDLLQHIKDKNIPAANKTFEEIMNSKKASVESREYKAAISNLFNKKNS